jgi:cytochrome c oxidase assembly protein subunit 15
MTSSNSLTNKRERQFRSLALLTVLIIYLLVLAGGIVRGTGSGMGCPDWPKCFGRWIPPTEASQLPHNYQEIYGAKLKGEVVFNATKTWIEYVNRLLGVLSGLFVLATLVASIPYLKKNKLVFWGSLAAFLLIGVNGWLGSRVVATELAQYMISLHLLLAILVVFSLLYVVVRSYDNVLQTYINDDQRTTLNGLILITILVSTIQITLGAQVRDALDEVVKRFGYDQRDNWISNLDWRFYIHRSFSLIVLALQVLVVYRLKKTRVEGILNTLSTAILAIIVVEIVTGAIMAYFTVPAAAQPIHLELAIIMIGMQFVAWLLLRPNIVSHKQVNQTPSLLNV